MVRNSAGSITLVGKVGSIPEVKSIAAGKMLVMSLAVHVKSPTAVSGHEATKRTTWHRVISFDPRVLASAHELAIDDNVVVHGHLEQRTYQRDDQRQVIVEIIAEDLAVQTRVSPKQSSALEDSVTSDLGKHSAERSS
jgi:single-stranded DNA-binding protein